MRNPLRIRDAMPGIADIEVGSKGGTRDDAIVQVEVTKLVGLIELRRLVLPF